MMTVALGFLQYQKHEDDFNIFPSSLESIFRGDLFIVSSRHSIVLNITLKNYHFPPQKCEHSCFITKS